MRAAWILLWSSVLGMRCVYMGGGIPWGETVGLMVRSEFSRHLLSFCSHTASEQQVLSHSQVQLAWVLRFLDGLESSGVGELGLSLGSR